MHEPIRGEILEQVLNRLVTKTASPVTHFIGTVLSIIVLMQTFTSNRNMSTVFSNS